MKEKGKKVLVAMSGGVDSSVAAALLVEAGYDVIGATMRTWPKDECSTRNPRNCCSLKGVEDARSVCAKLGIPHYTLSLEKEFEDKVIRYFFLEYSNGRTPNPCIICNQRIKFGSLLKKALAIGVDYIATGHYAKAGYDEEEKRCILKEAADIAKDQSYVLFGLSQPQLARAIFPLGDYTKTNIRSLAKKLGLKVHDKLESQEICFVGDNDYRRFLRERFGVKIRPGPIVDTEGNVLGQHKGTFFFTIGQRKGLGIAKGRPLYVIGIDRLNNRVIVGRSEDTRRDELVADGLNWISIDRLNGPIKLKAKIRSRHPKAWVTVTKLAQDEVRVRFDLPQSAVTPGQAVVFYDEDVVVGGGWIR